jgi:membrane protein implicated in regulation of membrane protease activity
METWLIWVVVGFALVIAELVTGTFYLLVIALGFFAAAPARARGELHRAGGRRERRGAGRRLARAPLARVAAAQGRGQVEPARPRPAVVLEGWTNESAGIARVRYRGASWDARVAAGTQHRDRARLSTSKGRKDRCWSWRRSRPQ